MEHYTVNELFGYMYSYLVLSNQKKNKVQLSRNLNTVFCYLLLYSSDGTLHYQ